jgi:hypothetical protein
MSVPYSGYSTPTDSEPNHSSIHIRNIARVSIPALALNRPPQNATLVTVSCFTYRTTTGIYGVPTQRTVEILASSRSDLRTQFSCHVNFLFRADIVCPIQHRQTTTNTTHSFRLEHTLYVSISWSPKAALIMRYMYLDTTSHWNLVYESTSSYCDVF